MTGEKKQDKRNSATILTLIAFIACGFSNLNLRLRCRGSRRRRRRVVAAVIGREDAEKKFAAHTGVGGVAGRPFQIGGVLYGQDVFV